MGKSGNRTPIGSGSLVRPNAKSVKPNDETFFSELNRWRGSGLRPGIVE
jgi:hypothetical protein